MKTHSKLAQPLASFGERLVAFLIDCALWWLLMVGVASWLLSTASSLGDLLAKAVVAAAVGLVPLVLLHAVYYIVLISRYGQTLGKWIVGIAVEKDGHFGMNWRWAFYRELIAKTISAFLFGLGYWWMLKDRHDKTWHDYLTKTSVRRIETRWMIGVVALAAEVLAIGWLIANIVAAVSTFLA